MVWIYLVESDGIFFNRVGYPNAITNEFAQAVIEILEKKFTIKYEKETSP